jgi:hypothetical protein
MKYTLFSRKRIRVTGPDDQGCRALVTVARKASVESFLIASHARSDPFLKKSSMDLRAIVIGGCSGTIFSSAIDTISMATVIEEAAEHSGSYEAVEQATLSQRGLHKKSKQGNASSRKVSRLW